MPVKLRFISSGHSHSCAITCEGTIKCWGANGAAQLGYGDRMNRGRDESHMGDNLPAVSLGSARGAPGCNSFSSGSTLGSADCWETPQAVQVSAGGGSCSPMSIPQSSLGRTCAVTANNHLKCWGDNSCGVLGHAKELGPAVGDVPSEMGDGLPYTTLDASTARVYQVSVGATFACAVSAGTAATPSEHWSPQDNLKHGGGKVLCWGNNAFGQLGIGSHKSILYGTEGSSFVRLPPTHDGALQVSAGLSHACAALGSSSSAANVKIYCWGSNAAGQLWRGDTRFIGDDPNELPDMLVAADVSVRPLSDPDEYAGNRAQVRAPRGGAAPQRSAQQPRRMARGCGGVPCSAGAMLRTAGSGAAASLLPPSALPASLLPCHGEAMPRHRATHPRRAALSRQLSRAIDAHSPCGVRAAFPRCSPWLRPPPPAGARVLPRAVRDDGQGVQRVLPFA